MAGQNQQREGVRVLATVAYMATRRTKIHGHTTKNVARAVRRLREKRGLSAAKLSERTRSLGYEIPVEGVHKIEAAAEGRPGARHINTDELLVLAIALGVSPAALLLPLDDSPEGTVEITGAGAVPADVGWDCMDGQRALRFTPGREATEALEYDLYSRPPGRRRSYRSGPHTFMRLPDEQQGKPGWDQPHRDDEAHLRGQRAPQEAEAEGDG
jgi:hypothetical protein